MLHDPDCPAHALARGNIGPQVRKAGFGLDVCLEVFQKYTTFEHAEAHRWRAWAIQPMAVRDQTAYRFRMKAGIAATVVVLEMKLRRAGVATHVCGMMRSIYPQQHFGARRPRPLVHRHRSPKQHLPR